MGLSKIAAKVVGKTALAAMPDGWMNEVKTMSSAEGQVHSPVIFHTSNLIGLHQKEDLGWMAAIGLRSSLTEGGKDSSSAFLLKVYSDCNINPRRAVIECHYRSIRLLDALKNQMNQLDQINREIQRMEEPETAKADPMTFEQWWMTKSNAIAPMDIPSGLALAKAAWEASRINS